MLRLKWLLRRLLNRRQPILRRTVTATMLPQLRRKRPLHLERGR